MTYLSPVEMSGLYSTWFSSTALQPFWLPFYYSYAKNLFDVQIVYISWLIHNQEQIKWCIYGIKFTNILERRIF